LVIQGGSVVKTLSLAFLADLQEDWIKNGKAIFPVLRDKHPQAYFSGLVALSKLIRWETEAESEAAAGVSYKHSNSLKRSSSLKRRRRPVTTVGVSHSALMSRHQCSLYIPPMVGL
jgi:hypothetical protein